MKRISILDPRMKSFAKYDGSSSGVPFLSPWYILDVQRTLRTRCKVRAVAIGWAHDCDSLVRVLRSSCSEFQFGLRSLFEICFCFLAAR